jgi:hypothetical protein
MQELELSCKLQVIDIIAAATLSMHPCTARQFKAMQGMSDICVDSGEIDPVAGALNEEVGDGIWILPGLV